MIQGKNNLSSRWGPVFIRYIDIIQLIQLIQSNTIESVTYFCLENFPIAALMFGGSRRQVETTETVINIFNNWLLLFLAESLWRFMLSWRSFNGKIVLLVFHATLVR